MGFNSAFKGLKTVKNPGNGRLNNLNDPVLNVLTISFGRTPETCSAAVLSACGQEGKISTRDVALVIFLLDFPKVFKF